MRHPSNILFLHGVNWWNVGDIAISMGMVAAFRRRFPRARLRCVSPYFAWRKPAGTADLLPTLPILADPFCFPTIASWHSAGGKLIFLLGAVGRILGTLVFALAFWCVGWRPLWMLPRRYWPALRAYASADVLISKGGGFLHGCGNFAVSAHTLPLCFGLLLGKRVEVFAQSIGPFRGGLVGRISKKITMSLLRRCQRVSVREDESARLLAAEGISAERCPDAAIDLPSRAAPRREVAAMGRLARGGHPVIALTVYPLKNAAQRRAVHAEFGRTRSQAAPRRRALCPVSACPSGRARTARHSPPPRDYRPRGRAHHRLLRGANALPPPAHRLAQAHPRHAGHPPAQLPAGLGRQHPRRRHRLPAKNRRDFGATGAQCACLWGGKYRQRF